MMYEEDKLKANEDEFYRSWNRVERIFQKDYEAYHPQNIGLMLKFIAELRDADYDKWFRAGQATNTLFIARAKVLTYGELGRRHKNYIIFGATRQIPPQLHIFSRLSGKVRQFYASDFRLDTELKALLEMHMMKPIDEEFQHD